jgi:hypothetical protein
MYFNTFVVMKQYLTKLLHLQPLLSLKHRRTASEGCLLGIVSMLQRIRRPLQLTHMLSRGFLFVRSFSRLPCGSNNFVDDVAEVGINMAFLMECLLLSIKLDTRYLIKCC